MKEIREDLVEAVVAEVVEICKKKGLTNNEVDEVLRCLQSKVYEIRLDGKF